MNSRDERELKRLCVSNPIFSAAALGWLFENVLRLLVQIPTYVAKLIPMHLRTQQFVAGQTGPIESYLSIPISLLLSPTKIQERQTMWQMVAGVLRQYLALLSSMCAIPTSANAPTVYATCSLPKREAQIE